ncbi:hypothetical protein JW890_02050 [candidate division WOR-3 bacterium]|nr:hypothetical protein [candidate division WOR-3 bacterium]
MRIIHKNIVKKWFRKLSKVQSPVIQNLIQTAGCPDLELPIWKSLDDAVVETVVSQMLSSKAANSIIRKLYENFQTSEILINHIKKSKSDEPLFGLSSKKQKSLLFWANSSTRKMLRDKDIREYKELEKYFIDIWGFGKWSVDMLGIFYFCLPDVWPSTDLKIKKFIDSKFGGEKPLSINGLETITSLCIWHGTG